MCVPLLAPGSSELGQVAVANPTALLVPNLVGRNDERFFEVMRRGHYVTLGGRAGSAAVEEFPILWGHFQVVTHCNVANELIVAVENVSCGPNVVVEAEQHSVAVGVIHVGVVPIVNDPDGLEPSFEALPGGREVIQEVRILNGRIRKVLGELFRGRLVEAIGFRDDVVEATVQDDLHAAVDLRPCDLIGFDLRRYNVVYVGLQLLPCEMALPAAQDSTDEPCHN
mmetsp:Transcript_17219/g.35461  ORF Transcript_17219/g.35461 Transcript_17219/m.35461 type:complete len:225 (+) Transcript_17219:964-1638(+)